MNRGTADIVDVKLGSSQIQKVMRGSNLVWEKQGIYEFDKGLVVDGINDTADLPSVFTSNVITTSFWVKLATLNRHNILGKSGESLTIFRIEPDLDVFRLRCDSGGIGNTVFSMPSLNTNEWIHILQADNGTHARLFFQGVESASGALATNGTYSFDQLFSRNGNDLFEGVIDDIVITNTYGDPEVEAAALSAGANPASIYPNATHYYPLNSHVNNLGAAGGSLTLNNFSATPFVNY